MSATAGCRGATRPAVVQHPAVRVQHQRLGAGVRRQLADVLGEQQVQPAQPVRARTRRSPRGAHRSTTAAARGHRPLLGQRVAAVRPAVQVGPDERGQAGSAPGVSGGVSRAVSSARQSRQSPDSATCVTSSSNPKSTRSRSASSAISVGGDLGHPPAGVAHQVHVLVLLRGVGGRAVPEVGVADQADPLEQVERAVDRGDVHRRCRGLHVGADPLRGGVPERAHGVEHQLPLRGHPEPALVQRAAQRHRSGPRARRGRSGRASTSRPPGRW